MANAVDASVFAQEGSALEALADLVRRDPRAPQLSARNNAMRGTRYRSDNSFHRPDLWGHMPYKAGRCPDSPPPQPPFAGGDQLPHAGQLALDHVADEL